MRLKKYISLFLLIAVVFTCGFTGYSNENVNIGTATSNSGKNNNEYVSKRHAEIYDSRVLDWQVCPYCERKIKIKEGK